MNIFVYSDESGVFDHVHYRYFVYGGILLLDKNARDTATRKYIHAENVIKQNNGMGSQDEAKANRISNKAKGSLFRSLNNIVKFGVVIELDKINAYIWKTPKHKQRFLDYAYKISVKRCLEALIKEGRINPENVKNLYFYVDEHTTATNGRYELCESIEQEFKTGQFSPTWQVFHPPLFPDLESVSVQYRDSKSTVLVRAADIVANRIFYYANNNPTYSSSEDNLYVIRMP